MSAQVREQHTLMLTGLMGTGMVDGELGLTGGLGLALGTSRYAVRAVFDVHVLQPEDSRYSWDLDPTGPTCRDDQSGGTVDQSLCSTDRALTGFSTEASAIIPAFHGGFQVGAGYRLGSGSTPFGVVGYGFNPNGGDMNIVLRLTAGRNLLGLQAVATLPFTHR